MKLRGIEAKRVCELEVGDKFIFCASVKVVTKIKDGLLYCLAVDMNTMRRMGNGDTLMAGSLMYVEIVETPKRHKPQKEARQIKKTILNGKEYGKINKYHKPTILETK